MGAPPPSPVSVRRDAGAPQRRRHGPRIGGRGRSAIRTRQVSRIGNNLNHGARWANTRKGPVKAVQVMGHLIAIERTLRALAPVRDPDPDGVDAPLPTASQVCQDGIEHDRAPARERRR